MIESFHSSLDRDYLNHLVFDSLKEAEEYIAWAFLDYNQEKPKQRLDWLTPAEFRATFPPPPASPATEKPLETTKNVN